MLSDRWGRGARYHLLPRLIHVLGSSCAKSNAMIDPEGAEGSGTAGETQRYANGKLAVELHTDGTGFAYYPSGAVAVCVSAVDDLKRKHFFYDSDRASTLIACVDEHAVGFAEDRTPRGSPSRGSKLVLTRDGGMRVDERGNVAQEWRWDQAQQQQQQQQQPSAPPTEPIMVQLNKHLALRFESRHSISVHFKCQHVHREFHCGLRLRRPDTYLDKAQPRRVGQPRGKVNVVPHAPSLLARQRQFVQDMQHKSLLLKPRSDRMRNPALGGMMADLERHFSPIENKVRDGAFTAPCADPGWRETALARTFLELPAPVPMGTEIGAAPPAIVHAAATLRHASATGTLRLAGEATLSSTTRSLPPPSPATSTFPSGGGARVPNSDASRTLPGHAQQGRARGVHDVLAVLGVDPSARPADRVRPA